MKYARLPIEELQKLEKDFVDFLVFNGITGEDWELMQKDPVKADGMIDAFSDVIWEGILQKSAYLIRMEPRLLWLFHFGPSAVHLLLVESETPLDGLESWKAHDNLSMSYQEKTIQKSREEDMFALIQQGCQIADKEVYQQFVMRYASSKTGDHT